MTAAAADPESVPSLPLPVCVGEGAGPVAAEGSLSVQGGTSELHKDCCWEGERHKEGEADSFFLGVGEEGGGLTGSSATHVTDTHTHTLHPSSIQTRASSGSASAAASAAAPPATDKEADGRKSCSLPHLRIQTGRETPDRRNRQAGLTIRPQSWPTTCSCCCVCEGPSGWVCSCLRLSGPQSPRHGERREHGEPAGRHPVQSRPGPTAHARPGRTGGEILHRSGECTPPQMRVYYACMATHM